MIARCSGSVKWVVSSVRCHFFVFRNSVGTLCVSWAFSLIECVAVWALKPPVPHTDVLKTHESQSVSTELLESKGTGNEHLSQAIACFWLIGNIFLIRLLNEFVQTVCTNCFFLSVYFYSLPYFAKVFDIDQ